jgi:hypothetical protein
MRRLALATAVVALAVPAAAEAAIPPPLTTVPVIHLERGKAKQTLTTCTADLRTRTGKSKRRLVPVACEQPPRSNLQNTLVGILIGR